jgi:hypothetical protein
MIVVVTGCRYNDKVWYAPFIWHRYNVDRKKNQCYQLVGGNELFINEDDCRPLKPTERERIKSTCRGAAGSGCFTTQRARTSHFAGRSGQRPTKRSPKLSKRKAA